MRKKLREIGLAGLGLGVTIKERIKCVGKKLIRKGEQNEDMFIAKNKKLKAEAKQVGKDALMISKKSLEMLEKELKKLEAEVKKTKNKKKTAKKRK